MTYFRVEYGNSSPYLQAKIRPVRVTRGDVDLDEEIEVGGLRRIAISPSFPY